MLLDHKHAQNTVTFLSPLCWGNTKHKTFQTLKSRSSISLHLQTKGVFLHPGKFAINILIVMDILQNGFKSMSFAYRACVCAHARAHVCVCVYMCGCKYKIFSWWRHGCLYHKLCTKIMQDNNYNNKNWFRIMLTVTWTSARSRTL